MIGRPRDVRVLVVAGGLVLVLGAGGCAGAGSEAEGGAQVRAMPATATPASDTVTPEVAASTTSEPPASSTPSAPPSVTLTPAAALGSAPYYLAYAQETISGVRLVLADPGRNGRTGSMMSELPQGGLLDLKGVSPDGKYMAYTTGETVADLVLRIVRLADGQEVFSSPLVTEDVEERTRILGEELAESPPEELELAYTHASLRDLSADALAHHAWVSLEAGLPSMEWSPDGRLLAFAAQIDGPSSDVYTYDVISGQLRRMTDGPTQVQYVDWSPDGRWIAHGSAYYIGADGVDFGRYMVGNFVSRDGATVVAATNGGAYCHEWIGSDWYAVCGSHLEVIRADDGSVRTLWLMPIGTYALSMQENMLMVDHVRDEEWMSAYIKDLDLEDEPAQRLPADVLWVQRWRKDGELALVRTREGMVGINLDGEARGLLEGESGWAYQSPTGGRIAFVRQDDPRGVRVLDVDRGEKVELDVERGSCVSWRPDGKALVFMVRDAVYFNDLEGRASVLVDEGVQTADHPYFLSSEGLLMRGTECNVVWVTGAGG